MNHFADRLTEAIRRKGTPLCVGLDPRWELLPRCLRQATALGPEAIGTAFETFAMRVLDLVAPFVAVVKPQSAFFEWAGPRGLLALQRLFRRCRDLGLVSILDSKRGDIASTATAYAEAAFAGAECEGQRWPIWDADALTINPYLGRDAVEPFLRVARQSDRGVFVLVRTSNPGAGLFQDLPCQGRPLYQHVAAEVGRWTCEHLGTSGFGDVGAVVGATSPRELASVRALLPQTLLLVPGFGAQGATAQDVAAAFAANGQGAIVNSSRGVTFAFHPDDPDWEAKIVEATRAAVASLPKVV